MDLSKCTYVIKQDGCLKIKKHAVYEELIAATDSKFIFK